MKRVLFLIVLFIGCINYAFATKNNDTSAKNISIEQYFNLPIKNSKEYKGYIELGYNIGIGELSIDRFEVQTSHGIKLSPSFYIGAGVGIDHYHEVDLTSIPVFLDIRANILETFVSPNIGLKLGYSFNDIEGFYMSPSVGCKIGPCNFNIGYILQIAETDFGNMSIEGVSFKIGYSF